MIFHRKETVGKYAYCVGIDNKPIRSLYIVTGVSNDKEAIEQAKRLMKDENTSLKRNAKIYCWKFVLPHRGIAQIY